MNLLIVGSDKIFAIENIYVKYLKDEHRITLFPAQSIFYDYYYKGVINKMIFKAGLSGIFKKINKQLIELVKKEKPDAVWVFKGMEITPETLSWIRQQGVKLVNYNPDNPFIFTGKGSGNDNVTNSIGLYDLHFTYNHEIKEQLQKEFNAKVEDLPFGFEIDDALFDEAQAQTEINSVCFIGNPDNDRALLLNTIASSGVKLDVFGNDWANFLKSGNVTIHQPIYADELWKTLRKYRVQLNMMRVHNEDSHNMRTFEIPGIGGIQLAPATSEHKVFFTHGKEIFLYTSPEDCIKQAKEILALTQAEADAIRRHARSKSLEYNYSYKGRALSAAKKIAELL